jgi:hypothetical protein
MTTMKDVAPAIGPAAVRILNAFSAAAASADRWPDMNNPQHRYARASDLLSAGAWHTLVCAKLWPGWAQKYAADVDAWTAQLGNRVPTWSAIAGMEWPTQTPEANPVAFASRVMAIANDIGQAWGVPPAGAWNPALVNVDPPPQWLQSTYETVADVAAALPIVGWALEALVWIFTGIASLFVSYADEVFGANPPPLTPELISSSVAQMAAARVAVQSIVEQAKGLGWRPRRQTMLTQKVALDDTAPAAPGTTKARTAVVVVLGLGLAGALAWALLGA